MNIALPLPFFDKYAREIKFSAACQGFLVFLAALVLDGGHLSRLILLGMVSYWCSLLIIMVRRNGFANFSDRMVLQFGFLLSVLPVGILVALQELF